MHILCRFLPLLLLPVLLFSCETPTDGPFGRVRDDIEEGLRNTAEDLRDLRDDMRASTDPNTPYEGLPLRMLVIISSHNLNDLHKETLLVDLYRNLESRGFEVILEDVAALREYRNTGFAATQPARLLDLANGLPTDSFGVLEIFVNGWYMDRRGSLSHNDITGDVRFDLAFRFAGHWRYIHEDDNDYWEARHTVRRDISDRQMTWLEDQIAQEVDLPYCIQQEPELCASYIGGVIDEAFDNVAPGMPRPAPR
ncbi:MAG: hypothetical protein ACR2PR_02960 [Pseudohongiellaceae bacterium]